MPTLSDPLPKDLQIRNQILSLVLQGRREEAERSGMSFDTKDEAFVLRCLDRAIQAKTVFFVVIRKEDRVIGVADLWFFQEDPHLEDDRRIHLMGFTLEKAHQSFANAQRLWRRVLEESRKLQAKKVQTMAHFENAASHRLLSRKRPKILSISYEVEL